MPNLNVNSVDSEVKKVAESLYKKNKRSFRYLHEHLKRQAMNISPFYRDFIAKVINSSALKIEQKWFDGYLLPAEETSYSSSLSKRQANLVCADIRDSDILFHELGHAVDFWFGDNQTLSTSIIISNNKTMKDIFDEEFNAKHKEIYEKLMSEFKNIINSNINDKAYDILMNNMNLYNELCNLKVNSSDETVIQKRKEIHQQLYRSGFVHIYYLLHQRHCYEILNKKYPTLLDALSSKYDFESFSLYYHPRSYYLTSNNRDVYEVFANVFNAKITSKHFELELIKHFLPKTYDAFDKLFYIFYDHIQQNKRFNDVKIKKEQSKDGLC